MRTPHPDPRPTAPRAAAPSLGGLRDSSLGRFPSWAVVRATRTTGAVLALAPLVLASCTDGVAANCPPLAHPEVLTVAAAAGNPCPAQAGWGQPKGGER